eukprot:COSAG05_NODE_17476_length_324_cov_1.386667_1_plen_61_part_10
MPAVIGWVGIANTAVVLLSAPIHLSSAVRADRVVTVADATLVDLGSTAPGPVSRDALTGAL